MKKITSPYVIVKKSGIHNNGIFARKDILKGTEIIEYVGEKITKKESDKRSDRVIQEHKKNQTKGSVYIFELNKKYDLDGYPIYNTARWINHSCYPNCETINIDGHIWVTAMKNIKKGAELFYDYGYSIEDFEEHPCYCGCKKCVGYIVSREHWPKLKRILAQKAKTF